MPLTRLAALAGTARGRRLASGLLIVALAASVLGAAACGQSDDSPQRPVYPDATQRRTRGQARRSRAVVAPPNHGSYATREAPERQRSGLRSARNRGREIKGIAPAPATARSRAWRGDYSSGRQFERHIANPIPILRAGAVCISYGVVTIRRVSAGGRRCPGPGGTGILTPACTTACGACPRGLRATYAHHRDDH